MKRVFIIDIRWCRTMFMVALSLLLSLGAYAQSNTINGVVLGEKDEPLIGVTIVNTKSSQGAVTNPKGLFTLSAAAGDILQVSYLGYKAQEVKVGSAVNLTIKLEQDAIKIDEVVAIGYGSMKKRDLTGAITSVSSKALAETGQTSIEEALAGQVAGLTIESSSSTPGSGSMIRIRGANSINASSEPLYVIDGIPIMNNSTSGTEDVGVSPLAGIAVDDIESIEVLKDASATAIYGAQGANGVIIVTTKKSKGEGVKYSVRLALGVQIADTGVYEMMDAQEYAAYRYTQSFSPTTGAGSDSWASDKWANAKTTDWMDVMTQLGVVEDLHFGVQGGQKGGSTYSVGVGYYNNKGTVINTNMDRVSLNFSMSTSTDKVVSFGINTMASYINRTGASWGLLTGLKYNPTVSVNEEDSDPEALEELSSSVNPYQNLMEQDLNNTVKSLNANAYLNFRLAQGLNLKTSVGTSLSGTKIVNFYPSTSASGKNDNGRSYVKYDDTKKWVADALLTYNKSIGYHRLDAMVGGSATESEQYYVVTENSNYELGNLGVDGLQSGTNPSIPVSVLDRWTLLSGMTRLFYSFKDKYSMTATLRADGSSRVSPSNRWGYFPSLAVAWRVSEEGVISRQKWISNIKLRAGYGVIGNQNIPSYQAFNTYSIDQTIINGGLVSALSKTQIANPDLKWETTSSVNVGIDYGFLKNRISGAIDIYEKRTKDLLLNAVLPSNAGVEGSTMYRNMGAIRNRGVEFSLNTINFTGKFFWKTSFNIAHNQNKVTDLGDNKQIPVGTQVSSQAMIIEGQPLGLWYGLTTDGVWQSDQFVYSWGNIYSPSEYATSGYHRKPQYENLASTPNGAMPGKWRYADLDHNGVINAEDCSVIGVSQPKFTGGLGNTFRYKWFDLNVMFDFSYGKEIFNAVKFALHESNSAWSNRISGDYWEPTMYEVVYDESQIPMGYGDVIQEGNPLNSSSQAGVGDANSYVLSNYIEDGSYLRLRSVSLGYTIPKKSLRKIGLEQVRIYATGLNLWMLTKYTGYDPTINSNSAGGTRLGYDNNATPMSRTVTLGAQLTF